MEPVHLNGWKMSGKITFQTTTTMIFNMTFNHIWNDIVLVPGADELGFNTKKPIVFIDCDM